MQSVFSWAPKLARKCESKHWYACGADGRPFVRLVYGHVITKFSGMGRFLGWVDGAPPTKRAGGAPLLKWDLKTPVFFEKEDLIFLIIVAYR